MPDLLYIASILFMQVVFTTVETHCFITTILYNLLGIQNMVLKASHLLSEYSVYPKLF